MIQEMEQAVVAINGGNVTKETIEQYGKAIANNVLVDGMIDPLQAKVYIKAMQAVLDIAEKELQGAALSAAEKYGQKSFAAFGVDVQIKETGIKYDYTSSPEWVAYNKEIEQMKLHLKSIELELRGDKDNPIPRTSTTQTVITFKKN